MTSEEAMIGMREHLHEDKLPMLGIFWYNLEEDELFGISKAVIEDCPLTSTGSRTIRTIHKNWWKHEEMRAKSKNKKDSIYYKDYTSIPRGRLFYTQEGNFVLFCGSWINNHIIELVKDEFNLKDFNLEIKIDTHWELNHGWSDDLLK